MADRKSSDGEKMWEHIAQLHRKHSDLVAQTAHGGQGLSESSVLKLAAAIDRLAEVMSHARP